MGYDPTSPITSKKDQVLIPQEAPSQNISSVQTVRQEIEKSLKCAERTSRFGVFLTAAALSVAVGSAAIAVTVFLLGNPVGWGVVATIVVIACIVSGVGIGLIATHSKEKMLTILKALGGGALLGVGIGTGFAGAMVGIVIGMCFAIIAHLHGLAFIYCMSIVSATSLVCGTFSFAPFAWASGASIKSALRLSPSYSKPPSLVLDKSPQEAKDKFFEEVAGLLKGPRPQKKELKKELPADRAQLDATAQESIIKGDYKTAYDTILLAHDTEQDRQKKASYAGVLTLITEGLEINIAQKKDSEECKKQTLARLLEDIQNCKEEKPETVAQLVYAYRRLSGSSREAETLTAMWYTHSKDSFKGFLED